MHVPQLLPVLIVVAAAAACGGAAPTIRSTTSATLSPAPTTAAQPPHVMLVVLENREYPDIIGSDSAPYINSLATRYGLATHAYGLTHPSQPNYMEMVSGSTQGVVDDSAGPSFDAPSIAGQLHSRGVGWRAYIGGVRQACDTGPGTDIYTRSHNPLMRFNDVRDDPAQCASVVPLDQLAGDLSGGTAPPFAWVTPDLCQDGHDCPTSDVETFVKDLVPRVQASAWYAAGGSIILTWDEGTTDEGCCDGAHGGHIPLLVVSARTDGGARRDAPVDHDGILRALEQLYGLDLLRNARCASCGDLTPLLGG